MERSDRQWNDDGAISLNRQHGSMRNYKNLRVYGRVRDVIRLTYIFTKAFPSDEQFGLTRQMRRAAISVGLNIAEGSSRSSSRDYLRFLEIARGSAMELEFALIVSEDLNYGASEARDILNGILNHTLRELTSLIRAVKQRAEKREV